MIVFEFYMKQLRDDKKCMQNYPACNVSYRLNSQLNTADEVVAKQGLR